jgi:regulatory protein SWI5
MLSNPTTLHQRQRQHRRQQSTPTAFDPSKVPNLPTLQRNASHKRGISLDQRRRQSPPQDINTNQGFNINQQQILRETQQQRLARPGQQQQAPQFNQTNDENYLISPLVTPQRQSFDAGCLNSYGRLQESPLYTRDSGNINTAIQVNPNDCSESNQFVGNDSILFPGSGNVTPSDYLDFSMTFDDTSSQQDWGATIRPNGKNSSGRRVSGGIAGRVAQFEGMAAQRPASRPRTPPNQNGASELKLS